MGVILIPFGALLLLAPFIPLIDGILTVLNYMLDLVNGNTSDENGDITDIQWKKWSIKYLLLVFSQQVAFFTKTFL